MRRLLSGPPEGPDPSSAGLIDILPPATATPTNAAPAATISATARADRSGVS